MKMNSNDNLDKYIKQIQDAEVIAVAGHISPDGDCVGACFAAAQVLAKCGKTPIVLLEEIPKRCKCIPGSQYLYTGDVTSLIPDVFIALDCGDEKRFAMYNDAFKKADLSFCVDHHISNTAFADYNYVVPDASSTCELVYELIEPYNVIDKDIAACLYAGIVDDTGGFCYSRTSKRVHEIAARLLEFDIGHTEIYNSVLNRRSLKELSGLKLALSNMVIDGPVAYSCVTRAQMKKEQLSHTDFEAVAEFLLNIEGVRLSFFVYERPGGSKVSLRSAKADVAGIAGRLGGGGHHFAAGLVSQKSAEDIARVILSAIKALDDV